MGNIIVLTMTSIQPCERTPQPASLPIRAPRPFFNLSKNLGVVCIRIVLFASGCAISSAIIPYREACRGLFVPSLPQIEFGWSCDVAADFWSACLRAQF